MTTGSLDPLTAAGAHPVPDAVQPAELDEHTWGAMQTLARALHVREPGLAATLAAILAAAAEVVDGADFAGINLLRGDSFEPQAVLGEAPNALDVLQQQTRTGPCIDASREQQVIRMDDVGTDPRWPKYSELAISLGVRGMLCVPMWIAEDKLGSISLYSRSTQAFGLRQEQLASLLAAHSAVALADAQRVENLGTALLNRDVIGQAKGILMERHRITSAAAFAMLSETSQRTNRKLNLVAEALATTGSLPS